MPTVVFLPSGQEVEAAPGTKILAAAIKGKVDIRYGCAACRCGTCGISVSGSAALRPMESDEQALLQRMSLPTDGHVRLACRTRIDDGTVVVDLDFQETYSPDQGEGED
jgi:ferredoxin